MADTTIVNTPANDIGTVSWVVAVVIVFTAVVGGFMWYQYYGFQTVAATPGGSTNINVSVPTASLPATPNTGGGATPPPAAGTTY